MFYGPLAIYIFSYVSNQLDERLVCAVEARSTSDAWAEVERLGYCDQPRSGPMSPTSGGTYEHAMARAFARSAEPEEPTSWEENRVTRRWIRGAFDHGLLTEEEAMKQWVENGGRISA